MTMFSNLFSQSDKIEVITDFDQSHFVGKFIGADSAFLYVSDEEEGVQAIALPHVLRCRTLVAAQISQLASELMRIETGGKMPSVAESVATDVAETSYATDVADSGKPDAPSEHTEEETLHADVPAVTSIRDVLKEEGLVLTPTLPFPKVLGKIDLEAVDTKKRQRIPTDESRDFRKDFHSHSKADDYSKNKEWRKDNDLWHLYPEAMGEVKNVFFKYGHVTDLDGEDLCFQSYNKCDKLMPGDKVLFTTYEYPGKGTQARSVVRVRSVGAMLKKLERMDEYEDKMKIVDIKDQLRAAFPDNEEVIKALDGESPIDDDDFEQRPQKEAKPRKLSANQFKIDLRRLAQRMLPLNYVSYRIMIAEMIESKKNSDDISERNLVYDLYTTLIKNSYGREERGRFIDEAVDYFRSIGQDSKADYFERLKSSRQDRSKDPAEEPGESSETKELSVSPSDGSVNETVAPAESSETETISSAETSETEPIPYAESSEVETVSSPESTVSEAADVPESSESEPVTSEGSPVAETEPEDTKVSE